MVLHRKYKYVNIIRYKILYVILITFIHNYMNVRFSGDKKMWSKLRYTSGSQPGKAQLVKKMSERDISCRLGRVGGPGSNTQYKKRDDLHHLHRVRQDQ